ncbi:MAG TPA: response regulator [Polyangiaceae bacterium]|nr:response regulator [Polyangiaceae bacterium]
MSDIQELTDTAPVLLVDDTAANLLALQAVLSPLGVATVAVRSGREALAEVEQRAFAVALVDVQMPEMDGFQLTRRLRETVNGRELPVLFVTALHRDEEYVRRGYASGGADYITKPYDPQVIRARVKAFIDLYRQRDSLRREQVHQRTVERDEAIRRLMALERISTAALETNDLGALLNELLATFIEAADAADSATILLRDGEWLTVVASVGSEHESSEKVRVGEGFSGLIAGERKPLEVNRESISSVIQSPVLEGGARALYGVPLLHEGQVLGVAYIGSTRAGQFSSAEKRLFLAAAERAALAVGRQLTASRLNEVLTSAPAFIAIASCLTGEFVFVNPLMRELCAGPPGVAHPSRFGPEALKAMREVETSGKTVEIAQLRLPQTSDTEAPMYVRFTAQPLRNLSGAVDRVLVFAVDITPQVNAHQELEEGQAVRARLLERERAARRAAELASAAKDEFLATVSHELRTPLNAILGWASIARAQPQSEVDRALAVIERNARAQARIVEDVLDFSRMAKGKMRLSLQPVDLAEIIGSVLESVRPAAEAKGIRIQVDLKLARPLLADPERLQQVVWNLLSNAVKYCGASGEVTIHASSGDDAVLLSVADTGQGIDPAFLPHVFEPFRQADGSTTRRHGGLGLGLAIVRQIVHAHGGTIEALSEGAGKGATFKVLLPIHASQSMALDDARAATDRASAPPSVRLDGVRVLLVDDDEDGREVMAQALIAHGADVTLVASAKKALAELRRARPHVLVSDIAMPDIDGYELIRRVRELPAVDGGATPALAVTAHAGKDVPARALASGYHRYAAKPMDIESFISTVAALARDGAEARAS